MVLLRINNFFMNKKLRTKLLLSYLLVALLPIIIIGYFLITKTKFVVLEQTYNINKINFDQLKSNVQSQINSYLNIPVELLSEKLLMNYLERDYTGSTPYFDKIQDYRTIDEVYGSKFKIGINGSMKISIYTTNDTIIADNGMIYYVDENVKSQQWYKEALSTKAEYYIDKPHRNENNEMVLGIYKYMNPFSGSKYINILKIEIPENDIYSLIEKEGLNKKIFILDGNNNILSSTERNFIGKNISKINLFKEIIFNNYTGFKSFEDKSSDSTIFLDYLGGKSANYNFKIVSITSTSVMLYNMHQIVEFSLFICSICLIFSITMIFLFSNTLTKRLRLLVDNMKNIRDGQFDVSINYNENDEIGELSKNFKRMIGRINNLINEVYIADMLAKDSEIKRQEVEMQIKDLEIKTKQAELNALQSQLNPHFLFNTMESIRMNLVKNHDLKNSTIIQNFSKLLRKSIEWKSDKVPLNKEIDLIETYLKIQKYRFEGNFEYSIEINETLKDYIIPKFSLQPIVENAMHHGIEMKIGKGKLMIFSEVIEDKFKIIIQDNGIGMDENKLKHIKKLIYSESYVEGYGVGLANLHQRLKLYYSEDYGIEITSNLGIGTRVEIIFPLIQKEMSV